MKSIRLVLFGFLSLILTMLLGSCTFVIQPPASAPAEDGWIIVRVDYPSVVVLNQLASELDVWEVNRAAQTLVARVTLAQYQALLAEKLPVSVDCAKMRQYAPTLDGSTATVQAIVQEACAE
jgi:hypothetical protein